MQVVQVAQVMQSDIAVAHMERIILRCTANQQRSTQRIKCDHHNTTPNQPRIVDLCGLSHTHILTYYMSYTHPTAVETDPWAIGPQGRVGREGQAGKK